MAQQVWYYVSGIDLLDLMGAVAITPRPIRIFNPARDGAWLSINPTWETTRSLSRQIGDNWVPLTMPEMVTSANGLYRIGIDSSVPAVDWNEFARDARTVAKRFEKTIGDRARPKEWRFSDTAIPAPKWTTFQKWDPVKSAWQAEPIAGTRFKEMIEEMIESAKQLLDQDKAIPYLVLIYSAIDTMAWLRIRDTTTDTSGPAFEGWVNEFLLPTGLLSPCTAVDFWGARCGILHTRAPDSRKSREGKAQKILYAFGGETVANLESLISITGTNEIAIHANDLLSATRIALKSFVASLASDVEHSAMVRFKAARMLPTGATARKEASRLRELQQVAIQTILDGN